MAKTLKQKVTFSYLAPGAQSVKLAGDFTDWEQAPVALRKAKDGVWKQCTSRRPNAFGSQNCVCMVSPDN
jgi:1,4-alpha-glucan branching enzyme